MAYNKNPDYISVGLYGADLITDTASHAGPYAAILALDDTVIGTVTAPGVGGSTLNGAALTRGITIFETSLLFRNLTLSSGRVYAYKAGE